MSYTDLVRASSPIGYWKLNGSGSSVLGASATVSSNASNYWVSPPLIANSGSSLMITSASGASVSIYDPLLNNFYSNYQNKTFTAEFWFSFDGQFDGSGYLTNLDEDTRYFKNNVLKIISIMNGETEIGSINYNYNSNTFRFSINGTGNSDSYLPVRNLNTSFYIVATYANEKILLSVNGEDGAAGYVNDFSLFPSKTSASIQYLINGNSLNPSASMHYIISDLAIYNYVLTKDYQRKRVLYGLSADKPQEITNYLQTSYFDFSEKNYHTLHKEMIDGDQFNENILHSDNLIVDPVYGILYHRVLDLHASNEAPSSSVVITSSGVQFSNYDSALMFDQYGQMFEKELFKTITCMFSMSNASGGYIFSIPNSINQNETLYASVSSIGVEIGSYIVSSSTNNVIATVSTSLSNDVEYEFGMSINSDNNAFVFIADTSETVYLSGFSINPTTQLAIGNVPINPSANSLTIKNFGFTNDYENNFLSFNFNENKMFMARLTSDYSVSQMLTLIRTLPLNSYDDEIVGSRISWDSMDNCLVQVSDDGAAWQNVKRGESIPNINYGVINRNKLLKILVPYEYKTENLNQSFDELDISFYRTLNFTSDDANYTFTASGEYSTMPSYTIKREPQTILFRQDKIGLYFDAVNGFVNGYAVVLATSSTVNTYGIDFWTRVGTLNSGSNFLFDASDNESVEGPYAYIDGSTNKIIYSPSSMQLYVNGASVASDSYITYTGGLYHIFGNFNAIVSSSTSIIMNGKKYSGSSTHMNGSYSHLNMWNDALTPSTAVERYNHFVSNNSSIVEDTTSLTWQPNWSSDAINSVNAYIIG